MPLLSEHQSDEFIKIMYIGDSGTGKTGSLVSLLQAGYSFKILDMDNGLDALVQFGRQASCDLSKIEYETYRDKYRSTRSGPIVAGTPKAFTDAMDKITAWSAIEDPNCIFVLDSFTAFGKAAYEWAHALNPTAKDKRQIFFAAQQACETTLALLTGAEFKMNVIVISHVNYKEIVEGVHKGFPMAIGSALGPHIPKYFNTLILAESSGIGKNVRRKIKTMPTGVVDLKTPSPNIDFELPLESGMATIFEKLKGK